MASNDPFDSYERLRFERRDHGVVLMTLSNPGKLNATDGTMHAELARVFRDINDDPSVRVVVVTGEGNAFSAGGDLAWIGTQINDHAQTMFVMKEAGDIVRTMIDCEKPIVSAINGVAVGAGLAVALMADISIIDEAARFTDGHIRLGVAAGDHAIAIWPLLCGMAKSKLYLLTSDPLSGEEAERIGLVSLAVPHDNLMTVARDYAERLARGPKYAIRYTKRALNQWLRLGGVTSHDYSSALELMNFLGPELGDAVENAETNDDH